MAKDKRKSRRRSVRFNAWIALAPDDLRGCLMFDVSDSGARIEYEDLAALPDKFMLFLSRNGAARRKCAVVWREQRHAGIKFTTRLSAQEATLVPKREPEAAPVAAPEGAEQ